MTILVYIFILLLNITLAFRNKQSKFVIFLSLIVITLLIGGAGPNYLGQSDYFNYQRGYENIGNISITDNFQIGHTLLFKLGNALNLDFFTFRLLIVGICVFVIYKYVIKKYSNNITYIILLYMLYPMIIDSEHLRNFIGMTILLIAIKFLETNSIKGNVNFLLMVLLASIFHTAFFLYGILIFANTKDHNRLVKTISISTIILSLMTILNNNQIPFLSLAMTWIEDDRITSYLTSRTNLGYIIPMTLHLTSIFLLYWSKRILNKKKSKMEEIINGNYNYLKYDLLKEIKFSNLVFWINIIGISFFPFFIMNLHFYRMTRNFLILNFITYSFVSKRLRNGTLYSFLFNISITGSLILWLVMDLMITTSPERVLIPFFTENVFF